MTYTDVIAGVAVLALVAAIAGDVIALQARHYAARALLRAHSHERATPPAPRNLAVDRRLEDRGPPAGAPERRRHRAPDELGRARRRDVDDPRWSTREHEAQPPDTDELAPPTRDMRAIPPDQRPR